MPRKSNNEIARLISIISQHINILENPRVKSKDRRRTASWSAIVKDFNALNQRTVQATRQSLQNTWRALKVHSKAARMSLGPSKPLQNRNYALAEEALLRVKTKKQTFTNKKGSAPSLPTDEEMPTDSDEEMPADSDKEMPADSDKEFSVDTDDESSTDSDEEICRYPAVNCLTNVCLPSTSTASSQLYNLRCRLGTKPDTKGLNKTSSFEEKEIEPPASFSVSREQAVRQHHETAVGHDRETAVGHDRETAVGHDRETAVGHDRETAVGQHRETAVGQHFVPQHLRDFLPTTKDVPACQIQTSTSNTATPPEPILGPSSLNHRPQVQTMGIPGSATQSFVIPKSTESPKPSGLTFVPYTPVLFSPQPLPGSTGTSGSSKYRFGTENASGMHVQQLQIHHIQTLSAMQKTLHDTKMFKEKITMKWADELQAARMQAIAASREDELAIAKVLQQRSEELHWLRMQHEEMTVDFQKQLHDVKMETAMQEFRGAEINRRIVQMKLRKVELELQQIEESESNM